MRCICHEGNCTDSRDVEIEYVEDAGQARLEIPWWSNILAKILHTYVEKQESPRDGGRSTGPSQRGILYRIQEAASSNHRVEWGRISQYIAITTTTTIGHRILRKNGVRGSNVNLGSLVVYWTPDGRVTGVFSNFDLSSTRDISLKQERARIVPFVVLGLPSGITKTVIEGKRLYQHDAESFIWVLTWVSLRYKNGKHLRKGRSLDRWKVYTV